MSASPKFVTHLRDTMDAVSPDMAATLQRLVDDPPCAIPWEHALLDATGEVYICCQSTAVIGDINGKTLEDVWNGERAHELREQFLNHDYRGCSLRCSFILDRVKQGKKISAEEEVVVELVPARAAE